MKNQLLLFGTLILTACASLTSLAQTPAQRDWCQNVIVPQTYRSTVAGKYRIQVSEVLANVHITEQVATTTLNVSLKNHSGSNETAELLIPVPNGAVIKGFTFQGNAAEPKTELLLKQKAKSTFESIVARLKDPALLEFAGFNLVRTSVFPVPANGEQKVQIVYENLLKADGDRVDYVLPRSGSVVYDTPWKINVKVSSQRTITTVYSPSHPLTTSSVNKKTVTTSVAENAASTPGSFKLSYLLEKGAFTATMFTHPNDDGKGGYFLLLAGMGKADAAADKQIKREITLVIDRSGSMGGKKIEQAKEAALQVVEGLEMGESFNIVTYSDEVQVFSEKAVAKSKESLGKAREFISAINSRGGTNLHAALARSLQGEPAEGVLPIVLFMTDGLPTVGETSEKAIRSLATDHNPHQRRVFSFGVGYDVNSPLLDKISTSTRGFATFVLPTEDVEAKVARVFRGLDGPNLADPEFRVVNRKGKPVPKRISHVLPGTIPDLFEGDQLVLMGKYKGKKPLFFEISGNHQGKEETFHFRFELKPKLDTQNSFVPRLWASRRIAELVDQIRDLGASPQAAHSAAQSFVQSRASFASPILTSASIDPQMDSKLKELTGEIIALSKEFGILTEYTSFLAEEGVDLGNQQALKQQAFDNFLNRAVSVRSGKSSLNQEFNNRYQRMQTCVNPGNEHWTADMKRASITNVQQCYVGAYYRRNGRWISNHNIDDEKNIDPDRTVEYGTPEFNELVWKLVSGHRNSELALEGDVLIELDDEKILVRSPRTPDSNDDQEQEAVIQQQDDSQTQTAGSAQRGG